MGRNALLGVFDMLLREQLSSVACCFYTYLGEGVNAEKLPVQMMNILNVRTHRICTIDFSRIYGHASRCVI